MAEQHLTPDQFIAKWAASTLTERAASQSHFNDLCALLEEPTPTDADPTGTEYAFERGASKSAGGEGWADVWKRGHFAWEYKGKRKDLRAAYAQLQQYAVALENPPLLVVSDMATFEIHTNWTNTVREVHRLTLDDLRDAAIRRKLKAVFSDPDQLKPGRTRQTLTEEVAKEFAGLAQRLRGRGHEPERVAHFVNRLVFCMFAEDVGLLPGKMFQRMLDFGTRRPEQFTDMAKQLFGAMQTGGLVGFEEVAWFNGGLFDDDEALPMDKADIEQALRASRYDWAEIDPSILGTLFERGLDPDKRSQLGAHYTDRDKIMMIVEPVVQEPLEREWAETKASIQGLLAKGAAAKSRAAATRAHNEAVALYSGFIERLTRFRVLDPACGSGNFLNLALLALKDLEHRANLDAEAMGLERRFPAVGPEAVLGIEINPYAAELARVSVWIGEIQWMQRNGFAVSKSPILKPLDTIECRDAILSAENTEAVWPQAGGWHGVGNDSQYTPTTGFETFPFPEGLTPDLPAASYAEDSRAQRIAAAAARLDELRSNWLNPADLVRRVPEVVPGYPDRVLPVDEAAAAVLKKRTLTNLYNERPVWLANAHRELDEAVAAAYGWPADLADDDILARLLALNLERAGAA